MQPGKVPPDVLRAAIFPRTGRRRSDVLVRAAVGEDAAVVDFGDQVCIATSDPITGAVLNAGWLAVHVNCNDVAASGGEPIGVLVTVLLPQRDATARLGEIMGDVHRAALELGIEVLGGHSEVTAGLEAPIVSVAAIGRAAKGRYVASGGARPGDALLMTKTAAIEGSAILAADFADELARALDEATLAAARALIERISVVREGAAAAAAGATALHDATEGGILGAVAELAEASGLGVRVRAAEIPLHPATAAIARHFGIDPLRLIASGSLLVAAPDGAAMARAIQAAGVEATVIGELTRAPERVLVTVEGETILPEPGRDELWRVVAARGPA